MAYLIFLVCLLGLMALVAKPYSIFERWLGRRWKRMMEEELLEAGVNPSDVKLRMILWTDETTGGAVLEFPFRGLHFRCWRLMHGGEDIVVPPTYFFEHNHFMETFAGNRT